MALKGQLLERNRKKESERERVGASAMIGCHLVALKSCCPVMMDREEDGTELSPPKIRLDFTIIEANFSIVYSY